MQQRTTEWLVKNPVLTGYHERQFHEPHRSTVAFCDWLESLRCLERESRLRVLDLAAGEGANLLYMNRRFPHCEFVGVELNPAFVERGNALLKRYDATSSRVEGGNLYRLKRAYRDAFDGVVSLQTLSWLPECRTPLLRMMALRPKWIAVTSLFFEGAVNCKIETQDYTIPLGDRPYKESYYNVYGLPLVRALFKQHGYATFHFMPFTIDIDLPKPRSAGLGTYTERLEDGRRLQLSGPLLLNWYFVCAER